MSNPKRCPCPCLSGLPSWWELDADGLPHTRVCSSCRPDPTRTIALLQNFTELLAHVATKLELELEQLEHEDQLRNVAMRPTPLSEPGGKKTGQRMDDYIISIRLATKLLQTAKALDSAAEGSHE